MICINLFLSMYLFIYFIPSFFNSKHLISSPLSTHLFLYILQNQILPKKQTTCNKLYLRQVIFLSICLKSSTSFPVSQNQII